MKQNKLTAVIQTYNRYELLRKCVDSAKKYCNRIIVVDGAFADYPHEQPYSTDFTQDVALIKEVELITTEHPWETEAEKRNAYLSLLRPNEWFIYLDDDEQIINLNLDNIIYDMALVDIAIGKEVYQAPRVIKYKPGLRYIAHYIVSYQAQHYDLGFGRRNKGEAIGKIKTTILPEVEDYLEWKKTQRAKEGLIKGKILFFSIG